MTNEENFQLDTLFQKDILGRAILQKTQDGIKLNIRHCSNICEIIVLIVIYYITTRSYSQSSFLFSLV